MVRAPDIVPAHKVLSGEFQNADMKERCKKPIWHELKREPVTTGEQTA